MNGICHEQLEDRHGNIFPASMLELYVSTEVVRMARENNRQDASTNLGRLILEEAFASDLEADNRPETEGERRLRIVGGQSLNVASAADEFARYQQSYLLVDRLGRGYHFRSCADQLAEIKAKGILKKHSLGYGTFRGRDGNEHVVEGDDFWFSQRTALVARAIVLSRSLGVGNSLLTTQPSYHGLPPIMATARESDIFLEDHS